MEAMGPTAKRPWITSGPCALWQGSSALGLQPRSRLPLMSLTIPKILLLLLLAFAVMVPAVAMDTPAQGGASPMTLCIASAALCPLASLSQLYGEPESRESAASEPAQSSDLPKDNAQPDGTSVGELPERAAEAEEVAAAPNSKRQPTETTNNPEKRNKQQRTVKEMFGRVKSHSKASSLSSRAYTLCN